MQSSVLLKSLSVVVASLALFVLAAQFVPVRMTNPPVRAEIDSPREVRSILKRACYDCHSNETEWPWYSRIAPVSWLMAHDVQEGRDHLNFSDWGRLSEKEGIELREEIWEEVEEGEMPLWFYLPMHPEARIQEEDRAVLKRWALGRAPARLETR